MREGGKAGGGGARAHTRTRTPLRPAGPQLPSPVRPGPARPLHLRPGPRALPAARGPGGGAESVASARRGAARRGQAGAWERARCPGGAAPPLPREPTEPREPGTRKRREAEVGEARPRALAPGSRVGPPGHGRGCYRGGPKSCRVPHPPPRAPGSTCCGSPPQTPRQPSPQAQLSQRLQKTELRREDEVGPEGELGAEGLSIKTQCSPGQVHCSTDPRSLGLSSGPSFWLRFRTERPPSLSMSWAPGRLQGASCVRVLKGALRCTSGPRRWPPSPGSGQWCGC